ncbi:hypothetical protein G7Y89_g9507 [Cudoniella acicularis]|uniref:Uncharacterized protein n=1 Tax=Cudoniella acicularis TaxID=354080 RepID=A0A8H4W016_9HELO|nr:hypothetical protein G7Y89_g9507 [Cudoniella acicularis]
MREGETVKFAMACMKALMSLEAGYPSWSLRGVTCRDQLDSEELCELGGGSDVLINTSIPRHCEYPPSSGHSLSLREGFGEGIQEWDGNLRMDFAPRRLKSVVTSGNTGKRGAGDEGHEQAISLIGNEEEKEDSSLEEDAPDGAVHAPHVVSHRLSNGDDVGAYDWKGAYEDKDIRR